MNKQLKILETKHSKAQTKMDYYKDIVTQVDIEINSNKPNDKKTYDHKNGKLFWFYLFTYKYAEFNYLK